MNRVQMPQASAARDQLKSEVRWVRKNSCLRCQVNFMASVLLLCLFFQAVNAQPEIKIRSTLFLPVHKFMGRTHDGEHVAYMLGLYDDIRFVVEAVNEYGIETYTPDTGDIIEAKISPDGTFLVWTERSADGNGTNRLYRYDLINESKVEIIPPDYSTEDSGPVSIRALKFIQGSGELTYLLGYGYTYVNYEHLVVYNPQAEAYRVIEIEPFPVDNGSHSMGIYDFSDDGRYLTYKIDVIFVGSDCCHIRPGYMLTLDTESMETLILLDLNYGPGVNALDLSGNGAYLAFHIGDEMRRYETSTGDMEVIDNVHFSGSGTSVRWIQLSYDGSVVAAHGTGKFADGHRFSDLKKFQTFAPNSVVQRWRPYQLLAKNIDSGQAVIVNKFSNHQLIPAEPLILEADGESILYLTKQKESISTSEEYLYISHPISYGYKADESVTGAWFDSENPGQGLFINVAKQPEGETNFPVVSWYSVDNQGQPYWLVMQGEFLGNTITGEAYIVTGSQFGGGYDASDTSTTHWGQLTLTFESCAEASVAYEPVLDGFEPGSMELDRLSVQAGLGCLE